MKKQCLKRALSLWMAIVVMVVGISYNPHSSGVAKAAEEEVPEGYTPIYTVDDLCGIRNNLKGKYILMNDIDLTEATAQGGSLDVGNGWTPIDNFSGELDGNGHRIKGMTIYGDVSTENLGLFGSTSAKIKNLGMVDVNINVGVSDFIYCGAVCGQNSGVISQCFATGSIVCDGGRGIIGGIVGRQYSIFSENFYIENCYNVMDITYKNNAGVVNVGGIAGRVDSTSIFRCYNLGKVNEGLGDGICAQVYYASIRDCFYFKGTGADTSSGTPLTSTQMQKENYYTNFDFKDVWEVDASSPCLFPQLKSCMQVRIKELSLEEKPTKLVYSQGDNLDLSGGKVKATYEDDSQASLEITDNMVSGYDMMQLGEQEVIVRKGNMTVPYVITVKEVPVTKVTLNKATLSMEPGDTETLSAVVSPENASYPDVEWSSSNDNVVTVDQKGNIRALKYGSADVTAACSNGIRATCRVKVETPCETFYIVADDALEKNYNDDSYLVLDVWKSTALNYTMYPYNSTDSVQWNTNNSYVAKVDEQGKVTAVNPGIATITGTTSSGKTDSIQVLVPQGISNFSVSGIQDMTYSENKSEYTQNNITVSDGTKALSEYRDYEVVYENNTKVGKATIRIVGLLPYTGTITKEFNIVQPKVVNNSTTSVNKPAVTSKVSTSTSPKTVLRIAKSNITSVKAAKKKLTIRWKKISGATGYKVEIAKNKKFTKGKKTYTVTGGKLWKTIKGAKKTTYYIRVRAYGYQNSSKVYGKYSSVKKKRTK